MSIEVVGKDLQVSDLLRGRLEQKLGKVGNHLGTAFHARVKLGQEPNNRFSCAIRLTGNGGEYNANASGEDLIKAADNSIAKIMRQVKKLQHKGEGSRKGETIKAFETLDQAL